MDDIFGDLGLDNGSSDDTGFWGGSDYSFVPSDSSSLPGPYAGMSSDSLGLVPNYTGGDLGTTGVDMSGGIPGIDSSLGLSSGDSSGGGGILGNVASGAAAGSAFGPWGSLIGAGLGLVSGFFSGQSKEQQIKEQEKMQEKLYAAEAAINEQYYQAHGKQLATALGGYSQFYKPAGTASPFASLGQGHAPTAGIPTMNGMPPPGMPQQQQGSPGLLSYGY